LDPSPQAALLQSRVEALGEPLTWDAKRMTEVEDRSINVSGAFKEAGLAGRDLKRGFINH
jgi:hypothetical protein